MKFIVHQYKDLDLTIHEVTEQIDTQDIISELEAFYRRRKTTYLIWDLNKGGNPKLSETDIKEIIDFSKENGSLRKNGKSAIITNNDLFYGLSRIVETYFEMASGLSLQFRAFRKFEDAMAWFGVNIPDNWVSY